MAAVTGAGLPYMGDYLRQQRDYTLAYERAKASLAAKRSEILSQYGFEQTPEGGYRADYDNQTGELQQQRRGHYEQMEELQDMQMERGFKGGLLQQEQNRLRYAQGVEQSGFMRNILGALGDIGQAETENTFDYGTARRDLLQGTVNQAIEDRLFTPAVFDQLKGAAGKDLPPVSTRGVFWGKKFYTKRADLARFLKTQGGDIRRWRKKHGAAYKRLS